MGQLVGLNRELEEGTGKHIIALRLPNSEMAGKTYC